MLKPHDTDILLIEDNPGDVRLMRKALDQSSHPCRLWVVESGGQALAFLRGDPPYQDRPRPQLIFLDLNLPEVSGRELLATIKAEPATRAIPVAVLTSSQSEEDVRASYDLYANCFLVKPMEFRQLVRLLESFQEFWFRTAELPP